MQLDSQVELGEWVGFNIPMGHFGVKFSSDADIVRLTNARIIIIIIIIKSFRSITCTGTDNLTRTTKRHNTQIT